VKFDRIPEPKKAPPQPPPHAPRLAPREIEALFWLILELREEVVASRDRACPVECAIHESWLRRTLVSHELEGRLFARAFPEFVERYALQVLSDSAPDRWEVQFMFEILGALASRDHPRLEAAIARWVRHPDSTLTSHAIALLTPPSRLRRHRSLFQELCARGERTAIEPLTYDADAQTMRFFQELKKSGTVMLHDRNILPVLCDGALAKMAIHLAPDRWARIEKMLTAGPYGMEGLEYYWASNVAWREDPSLMRKVVERHLQEYRKKYGPLLEQDALDGFPSWTVLDPRLARRRFSERFVLFPEVPELPEHFDAILLDHAGSGGDLTPIERRRLRTFGLIGDPEDLLLEILEIRSRERRPLGRLYLAPLRPVPWKRTL
jgi:hypothetical protein